ncbi:hypothetical protein FQZ97_1236960 [compost metagenome]
MFPPLIPAHAGNQKTGRCLGAVFHWIPAFAGMTRLGTRSVFTPVIPADAGNQKIGRCLGAGFIGLPHARE